MGAWLESQRKLRKAGLTPLHKPPDFGHYCLHLWYLECARLSLRQPHAFQGFATVCLIRDAPLRRRIEVHGRPARLLSRGRSSLEEAIDRRMRCAEPRRSALGAYSPGHRCLVWSLSRLGMGAQDVCCHQGRKLPTSRCGMDFGGEVPEFERAGHAPSKCVRDEPRGAERAVGLHFDFSVVRWLTGVNRAGVIA
jgi:hypothetical protein